MKHIIIILLFFCSLSVQSQNFFTSFFGGSANYSGDLSDGWYQPRHTHFGWGVGLLFELNPNMLIRGDFTNGRISASDANNSKNRSRNLSFASDLTEFSLGFEYVVLNLYDYKVSPYVFAGVAMYRFSPFTKDRNGNRLNLYELSTEGQGFYEDRQRYKLTQFCIPFGGGVQWAFSDNARLGFVVGLRQTFTDYLDDVSKTYVDETMLLNKRGGNAVAYAYRGDEVPDGDPYPPDGTPRGDPKHKDWYYFSGLTLRVRLETPARKRGRAYRTPKSRVTCPHL